MSATLGEKLQKARQERGISISEVAEQTRISPLYLASIEKDDYKPLPGGIFNKGFLKAYAKYIGYDEHEALREYSELVEGHASKADETEFRSYRPEVLTDERSNVSRIPTLIVAGLILAALTAVALSVAYFSGRRDEPEQPLSNMPTGGQTTGSEQGVPGPAAVPASGDQAVPSMSDVKVEFATASEPISITAVNDGTKKIQTVTSAAPASFSPRKNLRLTFSKTLAGAARLTINGKAIALPAAPANPSRAVIEIDVSGDNLARVWQNGAIEPSGAGVTAPAGGARRTAAATASSPSKPAASPVFSPR